MRENVSAPKALSRQVRRPFLACGTVGGCNLRQGEGDPKAISGWDPPHPSVRSESHQTQHRAVLLIQYTSPGANQQASN